MEELVKLNENMDMIIETMKGVELNTKIVHKR